MTLRSILTALLAVLFTLSGAKQCFCAPAQQFGSPEEFQKLLQELATYSPDPCGPPHREEKNWHSADDQARLFQQAVDIVTKGLNATVDDPGAPRDRAAEALQKLEQMSAGINASWPEKNRFHFQILELPPALVLKMTIRTYEMYFVLGMVKESFGKSNSVWRMVGTGEVSVKHDSPQTWLDLYPLRRGPSGNARFLARFDLSGCAGSTGVLYDAEEWNNGSASTQQIIKQAGALGMDDKVPGFEQIGKLQTEGSLITLPYCWFSPIDSWDNPSMCAVDTYDVSGDSVRFRTRDYNRPDLLPIAKAIEYAEQRDYLAVLGYCSSADVARKLVRQVPPLVLAEDLRMTRTGNGKEHVEFGPSPAYNFDVEERAGRWRVVAFSGE